MGVNTLQVTPGYQLGNQEILTVSILNQMAKPTVAVTLDDPFNDQNYFKNGNFYSAYWNTPAGVNCPAGSQTLNANNWFCQPNGSGNVVYLQSTTTPDIQSLFSARLTGATGITDVLFGQQITFDLSATLRRTDAISGWIYNGTPSAFTPTLQVAVATVQGNFSSVTVAAELTFPSCAPGAWTYVSLTQDLSAYANVSNGLQLSFHIPTGVLNSSGNYVLFSRLKTQTGNIATAFADDVSLFVAAPVIQTANIVNGAVTTAKIAALAVTGGTPNGNVAPTTLVAGNALSVTVNTTINSASITIPDPSGNIFPLLSNGMYINSANLPVNATISSLATAGGNITATASGNATATASGTAATVGAGNVAPGNPLVFPWLNTNPLNLPASWTQWDDEFDGTTVKTKWTLSSSGTGNATTQGGSRLSQIVQVAGYTQAVQSFTATAGVAFEFTIELDWFGFELFTNASSALAYLGLVGTSKSLCAQVGVFNLTTNVDAPFIEIANGVQTTGGTPITGFSNKVGQAPRFFKIGYDGTNLYISLSCDGVNFFKWYTEVAATGASFGGVANITGIVLGCYCSSGAPLLQASFDFIRKTI